VKVKRRFSAPREKVWDAWTNREQLKKWWGPKDFSAPEATSDFREGGSYLYCVQAPTGQKFYNAGLFIEIDPPRFLMFTGSFADEYGNIVPGSAYGMDGHDQGSQTVEFEAVEGGTRLTLRQKGLGHKERTEESRLWNQSFDKLAVVLS